MYLDTAHLTDDADWRARVTACAALEGNPTPESWAYSNRWLMATQEMSEAYAYAVNSNNTNPGGDPSVITDQMILSRYQELNAPPGRE